MEIICIAGKAQHGKDSFANALKSELETNNKRVLIYHHADYLKFLCKQYFGWDGNKNEAGRTILQHIGTDVVRKKDPDFWVDTAFRFFWIFEDSFDFVLIPDCRFENEINYYKESDYDTTSVKVVRVNKDGSDFDNGMTKEQKEHISETSLDNYQFGHCIFCESGLDKVSEQASVFAKEVL